MLAFSPAVLLARADEEGYRRVPSPVMAHLRNGKGMAYLRAMQLGPR